MSILIIAKMHAIQKLVYDLKRPYGVYTYCHHLRDVEQVLIRFGLTDEVIRAAAWEHDTVEDTRDEFNEVKVRDLRELIGDEAAALVDAVTTPEGANRKTKNLLAYPRIREAGERATQLKLADRIANVEFGLSEGRASDMYRGEHPQFRHALHNEFHGETTKKMWAHVDGLLK